MEIESKTMLPDAPVNRVIACDSKGALTQKLEVIEEFCMQKLTKTFEIIT